MAGKIIADIIEAPYNKITLNVGNTVVATMNASGLYTSTGNLIITQANQIGRAALPTGSVLQVVSSTVITTYSASSSSLGNTNIGLSITPNFSTSKILVKVSGGSIQSSTVNMQFWSTIYRNNSNLSSAARGLQQSWVGAATSSGINTPFSMEFLDSPNSTSALNYFIWSASNSISYGINSPDQNALTITLMEIAG
jgi:hypothetical protein